MTDSEQNALLVGRLVLQYARTKGERATLAEKLTRCGVELKTLGDLLESRTFEAVKLDIDQDCLHEFRLDQIRILLEKYYTEVEKAKDLRERLHKKQVVIE